MRLTWNFGNKPESCIESFIEKPVKELHTDWESDVLNEKRRQNII
jgi:hypothetical protein